MQNEACRPEKKGWRYRETVLQPETFSDLMLSNSNFSPVPSTTLKDMIVFKLLGLKGDISSFLYKKRNVLKYDIQSDAPMPRANFWSQLY